MQEIYSQKANFFALKLSYDLWNNILKQTEHLCLNVLKNPYRLIIRLILQAKPSGQVR